MREYATRRPMLLLAAAFAVYGIVDFATYLATVPSLGEPPFGDFYAFWSFARFVAERAPPGVYDPASLQAFQHSLDPRFHAFYPCPYPPIFLLLLRPLAALPYAWAYAAWIVVSFGCYLAAAAAGPVPRGARIALAAAAPSSVLGLISGQTGLITGALLCGGMALTPQAPLLGGAVLGVLAFKPQFFLLVPFALLAAREWRALLAMASMAFLLIALSVAAFGPEMWGAWASAIPGYVALLRTNSPHLVHFMPTLAASMRVLGAPDALTRPLQMALGLAMVALVCWVFRRGVTAAATRVLCVAAFLATPYAFIYDLPVVTLAVAARWDDGAGRSRAFGESAVLLLGLALPELGRSNAMPPALIALVMPMGLLVLLLVLLRPSAGAQAKAAEAYANAGE